MRQCGSGECRDRTTGRRRRVFYAVRAVVLVLDGALSYACSACMMPVARAFDTEPVAVDPGDAVGVADGEEPAAPMAGTAAILAAALIMVMVVMIRLGLACATSLVRRGRLAVRVAAGRVALQLRKQRLNVRRQLLLGIAHGSSRGRGWLRTSATLQLDEHGLNVSSQLLEGTGTRSRATCPHAAIVARRRREDAACSADTRLLPGQGSPEVGCNDAN